MAGPLDRLMGEMKEEPRRFSRSTWYPAIVAAKDGADVYVLRKGAISAEEIEGPWPTRRSVAGALRVGDEVIVDWRFGTPIIDQAVEGAVPANTLQLVASSGDAVLTTTSVDWEEVVRLDGLYIPAQNYAQLIWFARGVRTAPFGPELMQCRIRINDTLLIEGTGGSTLNFDLFPTPEAAGGFNIANWYITPHFTGVGGGSETRFVSALAGAFGEEQFVGTADEPTINSLSIEAQTRDTNGGNDELRFTRVMLFA